MFSLSILIIVMVILKFSCLLSQDIYLSPFIYDVRNKDYIKIRIKGLKSYSEIVENTKCNVMELEFRTIMETNLTIEERSLVAYFKTPPALGAFNLQCSNHNTQLNFDGNFLLVNSLYLLIQNVEPSVITHGESVSFKLEVFNLTEPVSLLCYFSDGDDQVILPTNSISGNKLSTSIACPVHQLAKATEYRVAVVYSIEAIDSVLNSNNYKTIKVQANRPKIMKSGFTKDLRIIWFQFDQNVEGPELCHDIFTPYTIAQISDGAVCWFSADHLKVLLGNVSSVKNNQFIFQFSSNNSIRSFKSLPKYGLTMSYNEIYVPITISEVTLPTYWLIGPSFYCMSYKNYSYDDNGLNQKYFFKSDCSNANMINAHTFGSLILNFDVILSIHDYINTAIISPEEVALRNSNLRNSVLELIENIKQQNLANGICLDSAMMLPNVLYTLEMTGTNILNQNGLKTQLKFKLVDYQNNNAKIDFKIISRPLFPIGTEAIFETVIYPECSKLYNNESIQYDWYFMTEGIKRNFIGINGPTLILDTTELKKDISYIVLCEIRNAKNTKDLISVIATDEVTFRVDNFDAKTIIVPQQIVVSFSRLVHLKVMHHDYLSKKNVKYKWSCKTIKGDDCLEIGNYPEIKEAIDNQQSSELVIREITLQPGRYYFLVQISLSGVPVDSAVSVLVVSYETGPHISYYWPDNVNPSVPFSAGKSFTIAATISYLTFSCLVSWSTSADAGYNYLTPKQLGGKVKVLEDYKPNRNETFSRNVRFTVTLPNNVKHSAKYLLKLNVYCASLKYPVFGIIPLSIVASPLVSELKVFPLDGIGFNTVFRFQTNPAYDTKSSHPIQYNFGYYIRTLSTKPIYFYSSYYWLKTDTVLPSVNSSYTRIKTILKACNIYHSCSITEGPDVLVHQPTQPSESEIKSYLIKYKSLLKSQMITESEAFLISFISTMKTYNNSQYQQIAGKIMNVINEYINESVILSLSERREYLPISLTYLESFTRILSTISIYNGNILKCLLFLRNQIYTILTIPDKMPTSLNVITNIKYIVRSLNAVDLAIHSNIQINMKLINLFLRVSEIVILNSPKDTIEIVEKKNLVVNIFNYAKQICMVMNEREEKYVGSLVGSFSVQHVNSLSLLDHLLEIPSCSSELDKKCIKQKSKIILDDTFFKKVSTKFPFCVVGIHYYDDFLSHVDSKMNQSKLKRCSSIYGYHILKNYSAELLSNEEIDEFSDLTNIIEIPLETNSEISYECRYWNDNHIWSNKSCTFLGTITKGQSVFGKCECPAFKYYGIFSAVNQVASDSSASESIHSSVFYDKNRDELFNKSIIAQRSSHDFYAAFRINSNSADFNDQDLGTLESSLSQQLNEKLESLSNIMKGLKLILSDPVYIVLHLSQITNITTDGTIQELARKLSDRSLMLYDLHRSRLFVPEQPLRIIQPRILETNDFGKNIAIFFAIVVSFLACFIFGSILIKRHQIFSDTLNLQQNIMNEDIPMKRPKYKELESNELIKQNTSGDQKFENFSTNVELSDSGITFHSDKT
ncbi:uncharacterized protein LOC126906741 [Daktulosphaira vitifoliae]|uniref:uncharacterized protein LOC126906741 n=1 Tax=Daktulosphaira vitifoliae TaxID=58002 RepID=UPI0021AA8512|nr:uncharacterized protein LOC126906741 [Daktulosphaira vitifoliae]